VGEAYFSLAAQRQGSTLRLRLDGEFDWAVTGHVEGALDHAEDSRLDEVVFDLSGLTFLDVAGLKTILAVHRRGQLEGFGVTVIRPRGLANRIFTLTRAGDVLTMADRP
jgi:anti-anti-sigma factor